MSHPVFFILISEVGWCDRAWECPHLYKHNLLCRHLDVLNFRPVEFQELHIMKDVMSWLINWQKHVF